MLAIRCRYRWPSPTVTATGVWLPWARWPSPRRLRITPSGTRRGGSRSSLDAYELRLRHLLDRVLHALAPETAIFHAAERVVVLAVARALVDPDAAALQLASEAQRRVQVAGERGRLESVARVVGEGDRLLDRVERRQRHDRREHL